MAGVVSGANAGAGADPRIDLNLVSTHDMFDNASFEEYLYWATVSRADEIHEGPNHDYTIFGKTIKKSRRPVPAVQLLELKRRGPGGGGETIGNKEIKDEKKSDPIETDPRAFIIADTEFVHASRALRTASWGAVFYLITTDILGPFGTAWSFAAMGYGPGVVIYTLLGGFAFYGGMCLWRCFLQLDSDRYPLSSYGDMAYRIYGEWARQICNILQFIQLLFNVGILSVVNAQSLEQILVNGGKTPICYVVCILIWTIVGMVGGQIRTLQKLSWLANFSIWLNVFIVIGNMVIVVRSGVNYPDAISLNVPTFGPSVALDAPIVTSAGTPYAWNITIQGLTVAVYAWGGATVFVEFMAEMRRPFDFWKGMVCAQAFIYFFYMLFGLFVYSYQGQFSINPSFQGIADYPWQATMDALQIVTAVIAAMLYGNIGMKILYNQVLLRHAGFPHLASRAGKLTWAIVIPIYWALSFIIAAAIPQLSTLQGFVGAVAIFQFSYTFPPFLLSGLLIKRDAMLDGDGFDPATGTIVRQDSGLRRWFRGYKKHFVLNTFNVIVVLASLATAGLGAYSAIIGIQATFAQSGSATSFTCQSPF